MRCLMSKFRSVLYILLVLSVVALGLASGTMAQTSRGTVTGVVTDATGAVIAKATVTLTQKGTNAKRETTTNEAGIYRFDAVDLGTYTLSVQASGFATEERTGLDILAARTLDFDFAMKVGTSKETVTVEGVSTEIALQTSEQVRGATFSPQSVTNLPVVAGDALTLGQLLPGTVTINQATQNSINQDGNFSFAVNGQRPRGNNFMIDGVENNDISVTGPAFTISNSDAIQEVNIQTSNFSAEFGRAGGAVVNEITKSGTNSLHGTATEVYTGSAFAALTHNQKRAHLVDPPRFIDNIPSGTIGGPVIFPHLYDGRNKTFFFAAVQWDRGFGNTTAGTPLTIPTPAGFALLQSLAAQCPNVVPYLQALGSLRGDPTNSPSAMNLGVPSATGTCTGSTRSGPAFNLPQGFGNLIRTAPFSSLDNNHLIRIDHIASQNQTMSFRWLYDKLVQAPGLNNLPGFDNGFVGDTMSGTFTDTYLISSRITNEFRFNFGRIGFNFPLISPDAFHATLQNYSIAGITGFGGATNIPQYRFADNFQYADTMSLVRGKHTFRFGGDFLKQQARQHPPFNERGSFVYNASTAVVA